MNSHDTDAWLIGLGFTPTELNGHRAHMDQIETITTDIVRCAGAAIAGENGEESLAHVLHIEAVLANYAVPDGDFHDVFHALAARAARTEGFLEEAGARIEALEAENARLRRGR